MLLRSLELSRLNHHLTVAFFRGDMHPFFIFCQQFILLLALANACSKKMLTFTVLFLPSDSLSPVITPSQSQTVFISVLADNMFRLRQTFYTALGAVLLFSCWSQASL
jgi:hypothetical protein